jgi:hypothetical protein
LKWNGRRVALAAIAAVSTSFAQVSITGGLDFTLNKAISVAATGAAAKGIAMTDAYLDFSASEDLGGGMKASMFMELNADGERSGGVYSGDRIISLSGAMGSLTIANAWTGGTLGAVMLAPTVSPSDHNSGAAAAVAEVAAVAGNAGTAAAAAAPATGAAGVKARSKADTLIVSIPLSAQLTATYKYSEGDSTVNTPARVANVLAASFKQAPFSATVDYTMVALPDGAQPNTLRTTKVTANAIYDAGFAKFAIGYDGPNLLTATTATTGSSANAMFFGASAPLGNTLVGLSYGVRDIASFYEIGAKYDLSKRTFIGASYSSFTNAATAVQTGATFTTDSYGLRLGHTF